MHHDGAGHPTASGAGSPDGVTYGSARPVWWQCAREHSWETTVVAVRAGPWMVCAARGLPRRGHMRDVCGQTLLGGEQSWPSQPEARRTMAPGRNTDRTAASVTAHSSHRAWWRCDECGHEWQASVNNRAREAAPVHSPHESSGDRIGPPDGSTEMVPCYSSGSAAAMVMRHWSRRPWRRQVCLIRWCRATVWCFCSCGCGRGAVRGGRLW